MDGPVGKQAGPVGLLEEGVALVLFVGQQGLQGGDGPGGLAPGAGDTSFRQLVRDGVEAVPVQEPPGDLADDISLFLVHQHRAAFLPVEPVEVGADLDGPLLVCHPQAPRHVLPDGLGLRLAEGRVEGQDELGVHGAGVHALLLEEDAHAPLPQGPDGTQHVHAVSSKPGYGFAEDQVDPFFPAGPKHPLKVLPVLHAGAGDSLVGIDPGEFPLRLVMYFFGVILHLHLVAVELLLGVGGHPAVGGYPQLVVGGLPRFCPLGGRGDDGDLPRLLWGLGLHGLSPSPMNTPFCSFKMISPFRVRYISETVLSNSVLSKADSGPAWRRAAVIRSVICCVEAMA